MYVCMIYYIDLFLFIILLLYIILYWIDGSSFSFGLAYWVRWRTKTEVDPWRNSVGTLNGAG